MARKKRNPMRGNSGLFMKKQYELYVRRFSHGEVSLEQVTLMVVDDSGKFRSKFYDLPATREFLHKIGRALVMIDEEAGE
jgi:hypothetical protein